VVKMFDYINKLLFFCSEYPGWSVAFFVCGFFMGEVYF